jgi:hypothetical protein
MSLYERLRGSSPQRLTPSPFHPEGIQWLQLPNHLNAITRGSGLLPVLHNSVTVVAKNKDGSTSSLSDDLIILLGDEPGLVGFS